MEDSMLKKAVGRKVEGFTEAEEEDWREPYVFIHACDPQFGFIDARKGGEGLVWDEDLKLANQVVDIVNSLQPRPRFMLINGDLVHAEPVCSQLKRDQQNDIIDVFSKSKIPVLVTSGNHDIGMTPTHSSMSNFISVFGDDYYSFYVGGIFYIALNSQYFMDSSEVDDLAEEQMVWLRKQLQSAKSRTEPVIVFMHIPLFTSTADEDDRPANIPSKIRMQLLEEFADAGVEFVFSGHRHRNEGGVWERRNEDGNLQKIEVVVTTAIGMQLGCDRPGFSVVKVCKDRIEHCYFALEDISNNVHM